MAVALSSRKFAVANFSFLENLLQKIEGKRSPQYVILLMKGSLLLC